MGRFFLQKNKKLRSFAFGLESSQLQWAFSVRKGFLSHIYFQYCKEPLNGTKKKKLKKLFFLSCHKKMPSAGPNLIKVLGAYLSAKLH